MVDVKTSTYPSPENEYLADFDPIADTTLLNQDAWQETETVDDFLAQCISFPPSPDPTEVDGANDQSVQLSESDIITGSDHGQHSCDGGKEWQASLSNVSSTVAMTYPESSPEIPISGTADSVGFSPSTGCTTVNPSTLLVPHSKRGAPMLSSPLPKKRRIVLKPATRNNIFTASQSNDRAATDNKRHIPSTVNIEKPLVKRGAKNRIRIKIVGR